MKTHAQQPTPIQARCHEAISLVASGKLDAQTAHLKLQEAWHDDLLDTLGQKHKDEILRLPVFAAADQGKTSSLGSRLATHGGAGLGGALTVGAQGAALGALGGAMKGTWDRLRGKEGASILRSAGRGAVYGGLGGAAVGGVGTAVGSYALERALRRSSEGKPRQMELPLT